MITNDATLLKVKHEVLYEVAKLAYAGRLEEERDSLPYKMVLDRNRHFDAVSTGNVRLSDRGSGLRKVKHRVLKMTEISYRSLILPVKDVRSPDM